jgi:hypothetical protein
MGERREMQEEMHDLGVPSVVGDGVARKYDNN